MTAPPESISLIDSGDLAKFERFGSKTLVRPSTLCIWERRDPKAWGAASAEYLPNDGWRFHGPAFEAWQVSHAGVSYALKLQQNGQIGIFPEHLSYVDRIRTALDTKSSAPDGAPRMLNLFAYTGLATLAAVAQGAKVTHVDLSKRVLDWTKENLVLNNAPEGSVRLIADDALTFTERELRREASYELIVTDPPSFSRVSKSKTWNIEEVVLPHLRTCLSLLSEHGTLIVTSHHSALNRFALANLLSDLTQGESVVIENQDLTIREEQSDRCLPCGSFVALQKS